MKYAFIRQHRHDYPIGRVYRLAGVSRSGYYAWRKRKPSARSVDDARLVRLMRVMQAESRHTYGSPRMTASLRAGGEWVNHKRVERLMRLHDIRPRTVKRRKVTTDSKHSKPIYPNLLGQVFQAQAPNQKWLSDITYISTGEGWLYLASVLDLYSRKIVGWNLRADLRKELVIGALKRALWQRNMQQSTLVLHSDRGVQYASYPYRQLLTNNQVIGSMSGVGNCYDNAPMESFFGTLKRELIHTHYFATRQQARNAIVDYIQNFYNLRRRHSALGFLSPNQFEARYHQHTSVA